MMKKLLLLLTIAITINVNAQVKKRTVTAKEFLGENGATITNTSADTLAISETVVKLNGVVRATKTWDDLKIVPGAFKFGGSSDPSIGDWQPGGSGATFKVYRFKENDEGFATNQMLHRYKEGTDLLFHIHWTPGSRGNEENGKYVGWKIDYSIADVDSTFLASSTVDLSDICSGTDDKHEVSASVSVSGVGLHISHMIILRIYRSDTGTDDTWVGTTTAQSPILLEFDIHYEVDAFGSTQEFIKN